MLEQFSAEDAAEPELRTFSSGFDPFSEFGGIPASSPSRAMQEDEAELHAWVATAAPGAEKEINVNNERRTYLHRVIERDFPWTLSHRSLGAGRFRRLIVTKVGGVETGSVCETPRRSVCRKTNDVSSSAEIDQIFGGVKRSRE